jgi:hypothetical protein
VNFAVSPTYILHPATTSVNASGSQIVAQFSNVVIGSPATFSITVTNPSGTQPTTSNVYYLPYTPTEPSVSLNQNTTSFLTGNPKGMVAADFFGNGDPGLAVASQNSNTVSFLQANYGGPFTLSSSNTTGNQPWGIVAADFLGAGEPNLAITNSADDTVTILYPNGGGTYRLGTTISLPGVFPTGMVAADFNGDGNIDLAVLNTCGPAPAVCYPQSAPGGPGSVTILLNTGLGAFTVSPATLTTGNVPFAIAAGDLNGDGIIDLVVANQSDNNLTIFMGNGDGTFTQAPASPATGNGPSSIAIGDFNGDGYLDLAVTNSIDNTVTVLLNQNCPRVPAAQCSFAPAPVSPAVGNGPSAISTADMNADGFLDLVVANASDSTVSVLLGDGTGNFHAVGVPQGQLNFSTGTTPQALALADFNQDGRLDIVTSNASGSYTYLRQAAVPQLVLSSNNASPIYGQAVTFSINFIPPFGQPAPTGSMQFFDGNTLIGTSTNSQSGWEFDGLTAGTHQVTAVYSGDSNFTGATSNAITETVSQSPTSTAFSFSGENVPYGLPISLSVTISYSGIRTPTGTVKFFDTTTSTDLGDIAVTNNPVQLTLSNFPVGTHVIVATYSGDNNFIGSSSANFTVTVTQLTTTNALSVNPTTAQFAQNVTLSATVQPSGPGTATGTVTFYDGSSSLGSVTLSANSAVLSISTLSVGGHALSAKYSGDTNFQTSTGTANETVNPGATTTVVTSNAVPPLYYGQYVTFTAQVTPAYGSLTMGQATSVSFYDGTALLGTQTTTSNMASLAVQSLTVGTHSITAQWSGTSNYAASTSSPITQTILQVSSTTSIFINIYPSTYGQSGNFSATVDTPYHFTDSGGTFTLFVNGTQVATSPMQLGTGYFPLSLLPAGLPALTVSFSGDANLAPSTSAVDYQTVNKAPTTTAVSSSANPISWGQSVTFIAIVTPQVGSSPTGTVTFYDGSTAIGSANLSANTAQLTLATFGGGSHSITAKYNGDANFTASSSSALAETVNQATTTTALTSALNPATFGQPVTLSVTIQSSASGTPTGYILVLDGTSPIASGPLTNGSAQYVLGSLSVGSHSIKASYGGDPNFSSSTSGVLTETVNIAASTTTLTTSSSTATAGQSLTFTATVQPSTGTTATGTVTFLDGTTALGSATLANNSAQLSISTLSVGAHSITASYSGNANVAASTSGALPETIAQSSTTTTFTSSLNPAVYGQSVTFLAAVQPASGSVVTGTVSFFDGSTLLVAAPVVNNNSQHNSASLNYSGFQGGTHSITAVYSGDSNYAGSAASALSESITPATSTVSLTTSQVSSNYGQSVTFTATVQSSVGGSLALGTVTFYDGTNPLGTVTLSLPGDTAQLTLSSLAYGLHSITAQYNGSNNFSSSTSSALTESISQAPTTTALVSSPNPAAFGQSVVFTATIQPPSGTSSSGTVTFYDGTTSLGTATISNNSAQLALAALATGQHSITATFSGNTNLSASTSAASIQTINQAATSATVSSSLNPSSFGQAITFTATVLPSSGSSPTGIVAFFDSGAQIGMVNLSGGVAQFTAPAGSFAVGTHSITAKYAGDANFTSGTSSALTQTVNAIATTTTLSSNANPSTSGQSVTFTASVQFSSGSSPTGNVTFFDGSTTLGTVALSGSSAQLATTSLAAGTHSIAAQYSGDSHFTGSTSSALTQTVNSVVAQGLAIDSQVSTDQSPAKSSVTSPVFSTTSANELLLAFVATDYISGVNTTVTSMTGGGLTWTLVVRSNKQHGTSEIWRAIATTPLNGVTVTSNLSHSVVSSLTVVSFTGANTSGTNGSGAIGAVQASSASSGAPTASLTTTHNNSWVFGVGNDFDNAIPRTVDAGQVLMHQDLPNVGDTYWVQRQNTPTPFSGASVTINDTAPTGDRYNLAICEVLPAQ